MASFLFFGLGPVNHLAGLRLTGRDGNFAELGCRICDDDDMLSLGFGARYDLPVSAQRIHGFVVAADEKGTRAMSVVRAAKCPRWSAPGVPNTVAL